jgi:hypothetical protein
MLMIVGCASLVSALLGLEWSSGWTYVMFGILFLAIIMGTWTGSAASKKGRSMQAWVLVGFFLPIIGLIVIYSLGPPASAREKD